jgi:pimeloyl-ACP methyl ester carboxylesterase
VSEVTLGYKVVGKGQPLLLVHGFGISYNIWRKLVPLLCPYFTVVMIELPGIGATPLHEGLDYLQACVEGIQDVRGVLGTDKWTVLGYSTGSRIAEAYVRADCEHVRQAIFLCPLTIDALKRIALRLGLWIDGQLPAFSTWVLSGSRLKFLISWLGFNLKRDAMCDEWHAEISAAPVAVLKQTIRAVAAAAEGDFSVPVRYAMIWGDRDLVPRAPRKPGMHDHFVHGRHAAPSEAAEEIARVVIALGSETKRTADE